MYVDGLSEHIVKSPSEIIDLLHLGSKMRSTAATQMNRASSRSHAVFTIIVERSEQDASESFLVVYFYFSTMLPLPSPYCWGVASNR